MRIQLHIGSSGILKSICWLVSSALVLSLSSFAATEKSTFVGREIPAIINFGNQIVYQNSDSLFFNGRLLQRGIDYCFSVDSNRFDLTKQEFSSNDTLVVIYRTAPAWLSQSFGQAIPEISTQASSRTTNPIPAVPKRMPSSNLSNVDISGAKTFRFSSQTAGNSEFGQSLDLSIEGKLTDDLQITGTISDRGYNPSYGTANSRLEELDKVNLKLQSRSITAQVGDIQLSKRLYDQSYNGKKISGAEFNFNSGSFGVSGVVARPKGRFETYQFTGIDGMQGPYQIGDGTKARPIVPNSESVWLDGKLLVHGSDNDYLMDYPTGRITFSVRNQIDRRSRIEIDYEPVSTDYQTELFSAGSNYKVGDSSFYAAIEWYREGDNKSQPEIGELSDMDRQLLNSVGDNVDKAVRSGIRPDTAGNYVFDSTALPDTVLQYAGKGSGDYSVVFNFVGANNGDYKFVGGKQYIYVGPDLGDYLPVIKIPVPERTDFYTTIFGLNNYVVGRMNARISVSQFDRNLFSSIDDANNDGLLLNLNGTKDFKINGRSSNFQYKLRSKNADYYSRTRLNSADFSRKYLLPISYIDKANERFYEAKTELLPFNNLLIVPSFGRLNYQKTFSSDKYGLSTTLGDKTGFNGSIYWGKTDAIMAMSGGRGKANSFGGVLSTPVIQKLRLIGEYDYDSRQDDYNNLNEGLRFQRYQLSVERLNEKISYEFYTEDSLLSEWSHYSNRNRITGSSNRRIGKLSYNTYFGYQWLTRTSSKEQSFLSRTDLRFNDNRKQFNIEASYALSDETRNSRGITYLEVEPGQGSYIFENGRYIPDPDGNFIQVEELLSDRSRINRGEKSFSFSKYWNGAQVRLNSKIDEELFENGKRDFFWLVPFLSDDSQPYLVYNRQYNGDIRFFKIKGGHAINISLNENIEHRNLSGSTRIRHDRTGTLTLKQVAGQIFVEEKLDVFTNDRDNYFIGGGEIEGYKIGGTLRRLIESTEYSIGGYFRKAESAANEMSKIAAFTGQNRIRVVEKGEIRTSIEFYFQTLTNINGIPSYTLIDNKPGNRGVLWSSSFNYNVRKGMRINLRLSGKHSDESTARITGRGEVVAEF